VARIIASSVRKGNILELDGKLCVVLSAESFFPGKGTPTTQIEARRLADGVKVSQRYRTTEQVERAYVEDVEYGFLYQEGEGYVFMHPESFEQLTVGKDVLGDQAVYLAEGMKVQLAMFDGRAVGAELPQRVVLEIDETEPAVRGQTATASYKPALLSNGVRIQVPQHITPGTKVVVNTADSTYLERSKD
jgi:elongation factor P